MATETRRQLVVPSQAIGLLNAPDVVFPEHQREAKGVDTSGAGWQKQSYDKPPVEVDTYQPLPEPAPFMATVGAGMHTTFIKGALDFSEDVQYVPQVGYNATNDLNKVMNTTTSLDEDDREYLLKATSPEHFQSRYKRVLEKQDAQSTAAQNMVGGMIGSLADFDAFILPVKVAGAASKTARAASFAKRAAVGGGIVGGASWAMSPFNGRETGEIVGDFVAGAAAGAFGVTRIPNQPIGSVTRANASLMDKVNPDMSRMLSVQDELRQYAPAEADAILGDVTRGVSDSAAGHAQTLRLEGDEILARHLDKQLRDATLAEMGKSSELLTRLMYGKKYKETAKALGDEVYSNMMLNAQRHAEGKPPIPATNPNVQKVVDSLVSSNYSSTMLKRIKEAGVRGADDVSENPYYLPLRHSGDKMTEYIRAGGKVEDLYEFYGKQFGRMFPHMSQYGLTEVQLGKRFVDTQIKRSQDIEGTFFKGMVRDEMEELLQYSLPDTLANKDAVITNMLDTVTAQGADAGKANVLKRRLDWDMRDYYMSNGNKFNIMDFADTDLVTNLQAYNRSMSGRYGLAKMGYHSEADFDNFIAETLAKQPAGADVRKINQFMNDVKSSLLGRPVGDRVPDTVRSLQTLASALHLGNSGLLNIADYVGQAQVLGYTNVIKQFMPAMRNMRFKDLKPNEARSLESILTGRLYAEGRMRPFVKNLEDNWEAPIAGTHEFVQWAGQSTRFLNGNELIRRHQIAITAGILDDLTVRYARGEAAAGAFFRKNALDPSGEVASQTRMFGTVLENWTNIAARDRYLTAMIEQVDNTALMVRNGEIPHFMQHSVAGKMMFPYMQFVFGATNKVLRRTYQRDGATGVAMLMIAQAPVAAMIAASINVINGREWNDKLTERSVGAMSSLGILSVPISAAMNGEFRGGTTAFAPINSLMKLGQILTTGEVSTGIGDKTRAAKASDVVKNTPFVAVMPAARLLSTTVLDGD